MEYSLDHNHPTGAIESIENPEITPNDHFGATRGRAPDKKHVCTVDQHIQAHEYCSPVFEAQ
jgi:hypothetical protein